MVGSLNPSDKRVTIIGAGISGLIIGYQLKKKGYSVSIHEKSNRVGGLIQTRSNDYGMVESAAHSLLVNEEVKQFMDELGIELLPVNPKSKARYIYRNGKMRKMPLTFAEIIKTIFRFFRKPIITDLDSASLQQWGEAYLGKPATQFLLGPFVSGIFATTPSELNAQLSFPKLIPSDSSVSLFQHVKSLRSKKERKPRPQMMVLKQGMEDLVQKLAQKLSENIHLNSEIKNVNEIEGNVIYSVPTLELRTLLQNQNLINSTTVTHSLEKIRYSPLITATVFYSKNAFSKPPRGVGVLIPRGEKMRLLGCLFNSSTFSNRTHDESTISLTAMLGGTADPGVIELSDPELRALIHTELSQLIGAHRTPLSIEITRWRRAIPIYSSDLKDFLALFQTQIALKPGQILFSNYSGQVSIRGMIETALTI